MVTAGQAAAIRVRGLRKSYGTFEAVRGIDFNVEPGEVFALLGPNGAGKTTTLEILEGFRARTGGEVRVLGVDPGTDAALLRRHVGIVLQEAAIEPVAPGLDFLCRGIRRTSKSERMAAERGCLIYDALYEELKAEPTGQD